MVHYLNVCEIDGSKIEPVDVITFGSPCQDMSIAGKREGLKHSDQGNDETTRSGLFYEAVRIIKEMRKATHGEYPEYAVWENVPGAFSSNKGWDFHAVLEALCSVCDNSVSIPRSYDKRKPNQLVWYGAGEIVGADYSVAWRTLDAQYWGVPQRRKRIYLVLDLNTRCARDILFKPEGLRGNLPQSNDEGRGAAADAVGGADGSVGNHGDIACCLDASYYKGVEERNGIERQIVAMATQQGGAEMAQNLCPTITAAAGMSGNNQPIIAFDRATFNQGINAQYDFDVTEGGIVSTVVAKGPSGICYAKQRNDEYADCRVASCQQARQYKDFTDIVVQSPMPPRRYIIRRLMPVECARLQGFPDWWGELTPYNPADAEFWESVRKTHAEINGMTYKPVKDKKKWYDKLHNDGAEYKMWGNGIALPNATYVLCGISEQGAKTLGSLFDGSGGFPLAGVINGITPLWSSEIEPYPIAVTVSRFGREP